MPTFDGDTLTITLDSGFTEIDVIDDLYEKWKDWMLASPINRKYPQAFISDGGNPLSSIINQGSYIFLRNDYGWRIKPPEENITIYFTGNLAVVDTTLPAFIPTVGNFTAAILGLQPVTQGVTESMASQLAFNTFQGAVCIDAVNGYDGTGLIGSDQIGTRRAPVKNPADAKTIADREGLHIFQLVSSLTLDSIDLSNGYQLIGDSPFLQLNALASADVSNCNMRNLTLLGELDGLNLVENCSVGSVTNTSGFFSKCAFTSTVTLSNDLYVFECYSQVPGSGYPTISTGIHDLVLRDYHGSVGVSNSTSGVMSIGVYGGRLILENSCTGGTCHARGEPFEIIDNSVGATLINETEGTKVNDIHAANYNRRKHDSTANTITIYAADNTTPLHVFDVTSNLDDITPQ